ncbi:phosphohistidine phosphatase [Shewanella sp.]|uniref:phosphohistidine phosphatase n=1 Tax=Shewanella sp. TaxID=50422 RepID=UPI003568C000
MLLISLVSVTANGADIWLFRHAEKATGEDPSLTSQGHLRAQRIADIILSAPSTNGQLRLFTTDYQRTRQTITPLAEASDKELGVYHPAQLEALAAELRLLPGTLVVAGHSNTTPRLLKLLTGLERTIPEDRFDQLFHLIPTIDGFKLEELSSNSP